MILFLIILQISNILKSVNASFYKICALDSKNIVLNYDFTSSEFYNTGQPRTNTTISETDLVVPFQVEARICPCAPSHYCLIGDGNVCGLSRDHSNPVTCFYLSTKLTFTRNLWPVIILLYWALFVYFIATTNGRHVRSFIISKLFPSWNERTAQEVLNAESQLQNRIREIALAQQVRLFGTEPTNENSELVLKIKKFEASSDSPKSRDTLSTINDENYQEEDSEVCCTICMAIIEEGDRIGALSCNHCFHAECLKQWLKRRNVCPLCLAPNIAASRPRSTITSTSSSMTNSITTSNNTNPNTPLNSMRIQLFVDTELAVQSNSPTPPSIPRGRRDRISRGFEGFLTRRQLFHFNENNERVTNTNSDHREHDSARTTEV